MAKSYVTQFTEYVNKQQNDLNTKLRTKGLSPSPNATLGSLVSDVDGLRESFGVEKYERDPNFPDIDTMFDNDPLRAVNGGPYAGCSYIIMQVDINKKVGIKLYRGSNCITHFYANKLVVSDGTEYDEPGSTNLVHTVGDDGIFYGEDELPYCLLKIYRTDFYIAKSSLISDNLYPGPGMVEIIEDCSVGCYLTRSTTAITGYSSTDTYSLVYFRYVGSNGNETNIDTSGIQWQVPLSSSSSYGLYTLKCIRVDGPNKFTWYNSYGISLEKLILNGQSYATSNNIATSGTSYPDLIERLEYLKLPYNTTTTTSNIFCTIKELFIPDCYTQVSLVRGTGNSFSNAVSMLEKVHLGNGLTSWIVLSNYQTYLRNLKHITTSENIYGTNTTAVTLDLSTCYLLTKQSVLNLFNGVADRTDMTANIIKLPARIKSFLTDEEKAILTNKNWTLS